MKYPKCQQYKHTKKAYRVRNWPEYERGLRGRGDLTLWFSEDAIQAWRAPTNGRAGGQRLYSRTAIETALTVRMVYGLALRRPRASFAPSASFSSWASRFPTTRR